MRSHVIITGTGRTGTTFLVQLLTVLGVDTGFASPDEGIYENCDAGMEWDIRRPDAPYVVKSPYLCESLDEILSRGDVQVEHAFVPVRDLFAAAESRRDVMRRTNLTAYPADSVPGGLWRTEAPDGQEAALEHELYLLVHTLARHDVPLTLLDFPRLTRDPEYLFRKLAVLLNGRGYEEFVAAFHRVARPDRIHDFRRR